MLVYFDPNFPLFSIFESYLKYHCWITINLNLVKAYLNFNLLIDSRVNCLSFVNYFEKFTNLSDFKAIDQIKVLNFDFINSFNSIIYSIIGQYSITNNNYQASIIKFN